MDDSPRESGRQRSLHRVVDLLALDADGGLVLIEVKNEKSTRAVIGQTLEYLAQYTETAVEDLEDDYARLNAGSNLEADYRKTFNKDLNVTPQRRVYLVAPSFDSHSAVCVHYLGERLRGDEVKYNLVRTRREGDGFSMEAYESPRPTHPKNIQQGFAVTLGGRLLYVLESGPRPVMWYVGKRTGHKGISLVSGSALTRRSLTVITRMVIPEQQPDDVSVCQSGTVWQHREKPGTSAKLLGELVVGAVDSSQRRFAVIARFEDGKFLKIQRKVWSDFFSGWRRVRGELPGWGSVVAAARG